MRIHLSFVVLLVAVSPIDALAGRVLDLLARGGPLVIAHRGSSGEAPENTLPAFRRALADQADLVELDYLHSADGIPVVIHDETLDRTTDALERWGGAKIPVGERTAAEIRGLDAGRWFAPAFAGTTVPTLLEALETIQPTTITLIERKGGDPATLVRLLRDRGWLTDVVVQSFDWQYIRTVRQLAPEVVIAALGPPQRFQDRELSDEEKVLAPHFIDAVSALGAAAVVWNDRVTAEAIRYAHDQGLRVWVYTVNDAEKARHLVGRRRRYHHRPSGGSPPPPLSSGERLAGRRVSSAELEEAGPAEKYPPGRSTRPGNAYVRHQAVDVINRPRGGYHAQETC